ncbi:MAG: hypothetical protein WC627_01560 [Legionella sp.]
MLFTLAAVILFTSIFVFFSDEFIKISKRVLEIKGAKLILPLAIASWFVFTFIHWILWCLYYYQEVLIKAYEFLTKWIPYRSYTPKIALIVILSLVYFVPTIVLQRYFLKRTYLTYKSPYVTSGFIWLVTSMMIVVSQAPIVL